MEPRRVLICVAIQLEAQAVCHALGLALDKSRNGAQGMHGTKVPVEVRIVGVRAIAMPQELSPEEVACVISAGLAGALDPGLEIGAIVEDDGLCASDEIVATVAQKQKLFQQARRRAVDMESEVIRRVAERCGVPFRAIRAISDRADEAIDPTVLGLVDPMGRPRPMAVATTLARRPMLIKSLLRLRSNSELAAKRLGERLRSFLEAFESQGHGSVL
jgi:adenosylhomocysteine nucleosidase